MFANGSEKVYTTNDVTCNSTFVASHQAPCLHVLYLRKLASNIKPDICIFEKDLFHIRYYRQDLIQIFNSESQIVSDENRGDMNNNFDNIINSEEILNEENSSKEKGVRNMSDKYKFKLIIPLAMSIANLASIYDTQKFLQIKEELHLVEARVRRGNSIFPSGPSSAEYTSIGI